MSPLYTTAPLLAVTVPDATTSYSLCVTFKQSGGGKGGGFAGSVVMLFSVPLPVPLPVSPVASAGLAVPNNKLRAKKVVTMPGIVTSFAARDSRE